MKNCFLIVNYNDFKSTKHLVDNIITFKCIDTILIVDNDSSKSEKEKLKTLESKKVEIIYNNENGGYSNAINFGTRYLIDKYQNVNFVISNSDIVILSDDDLKILIDTLNDKTIGLVGPQVLELGKISRGMKRYKPITDFWMGIPLIKHLVRESKYLYKEDYYKEKQSEVDIITSSFFLIASDTLQKINFMDENVFLYYEDFILSKKVSELGLKIVVCNDVKVKHLYSVSVDKTIKKVDQYKLFKRSQYYYHTTYNKANALERFLFNISSACGYFSRVIINHFKK